MKKETNEEVAKRVYEKYPEKIFKEDEEKYYRLLNTECPDSNCNGILKKSPHELFSLHCSKCSKNINLCRG